MSTYIFVALLALGATADIAGDIGSAEQSANQRTAAGEWIWKELPTGRGEHFVGKAEVLAVEQIVADVSIQEVSLAVAEFSLADFSLQEPGNVQSPIEEHLPSPTPAPADQPQILPSPETNPAASASPETSPEPSAASSTSPATSPAASPIIPSPSVSPLTLAGTGQVILMLPSPPPNLDVNASFASQYIYQVPAVNRDTDLTLVFSCGAGFTGGSAPVYVLLYSASDLAAPAEVCRTLKFVFVNCPLHSMVPQCEDAGQGTKFSGQATGPGIVGLRALNASPSPATTPASGGGSNTSLLYLLFLLFLIPVILGAAWLVWAKGLRSRRRPMEDVMAHAIPMVPVCVVDPPQADHPSHEAFNYLYPIYEGTVVPVPPPTPADNPRHAGVTPEW